MEEKSQRGCSAEDADYIQRRSLQGGDGEMGFSLSALYESPERKPPTPGSLSAQLTPPPSSSSPSPAATCSPSDSSASSAAAASSAGDDASRASCPFGTALPPVDVGRFALTPLLKKLLHLRQAFERPLLDVFGFPFFLRHQVAAASCCSCCASCCCCDVSTRAPRMQVASSSPRPAAGYPSGSSSARAPPAGAPVASLAEWLIPPCGAGSPPACTHACVERTCRVSALQAAAAQLARTMQSSLESAPRGASTSYEPLPGEAGDAERRRKNGKKRRRLVDEDVAAGVEEASLPADAGARRSREEREVELLLAKNVLRQIRLPGVAHGHLVLFFTSDWLHFLQRCVWRAQRQALAELRKQQGSGSKPKAEAQAGGEGAASPCAPSFRPSRKALSSGAASAFFPATQPEAHPSMRRRRDVLLHLPCNLGKQLRAVLSANVLSGCPHTELRTVAVQRAVQEYLQTWRERRREAGVLLEAASRKRQELRTALRNPAADEETLRGVYAKMKGAADAGRERDAAAVSRRGLSAGGGMERERCRRRPEAPPPAAAAGASSSRHDEDLQRRRVALLRVEDVLARGVRGAEELLTLREAWALGPGLGGGDEANFEGGTTGGRELTAELESGVSARFLSSWQRAGVDEGEEDVCEARVHALTRCLLGPGENGGPSLYDAGLRSDDAAAASASRGDSSSAEVRGASSALLLICGGESRDSSSESAEDLVLLLLHELNLVRSAVGRGSLALCIPQQGLLVRWLLGGRKEILSRLHARKFKELPWADVERRGLLHTGLGSRFTLLDLRGKGDLDAVDISSGLVVRLRGELRRGMRVY
ncbi:hypothetical protein BESB_021650 [Besnoitia besnoiti]|uniref:Serine-threonine protein kinase 19 n=1 Tax=Besnoitia besnoiti TaxID=94643 RepID=A0A2A9M4T4_BESBE|nr:hypothetical protein BESB_021650 [Besnoitia besnoiti]PFH32224.1 hypothetical protein BESB_021650 [Besnoitia besnoiti]